MTKRLTPEQLAKNRAAGKKPGRPAYVPTPESRQHVARMIGLGATQELVASTLKISVDTLAAYYKTELAMGAEQANFQVAGTLFAMATSKENVAATIFWLKTRAHWKESPIELTGADGAPLNPPAGSTVPIEEYKAALRDVMKEF